jgi:hypothetical protein
LTKPIHGSGVLSTRVVSWQPCEQEQSAYWVIDASLAINTAGDRYSIGVFGQNLTDRTILSNTWVMPLNDRHLPC